MSFGISIIFKIYCFSSINNSIQAETKMFIIKILATESTGNYKNNNNNNNNNISNPSD